MKKILVYAGWAELEKEKLLGTLKAERIRGREVFSFSYDDNWLNSGHAQELDPDLRLFKGPQYLSDEKSNFGLFLDSSPDRWGRTLMDQREAILAQKERRATQKLFESDYLLGVNDETRMGAIRFKITTGGPYLNHQPDLKAPPFTSIRELAQASLKIEDDDFFQDKQALRWLKMLIAPGSSLGGARPKANVRDAFGQLWIAKFPSKKDDFDKGAWEYLIHLLAKEIGLDVPEAICQKFGQKQHTFLSKRFDRIANEKRVHFSSAMTLLGYKDGNNFQDGISYLEIIDILEKYGASPSKDIQELWKRIVFSVLVSNTDDHLRNHGFLLTPQGWRLSPAYDINPNPKGIGLSLNISLDDNRLDLTLCKEVAGIFRWNTQEADNFISHAKEKIKTWQTIASQLHIANSEQTLMAPAFSLIG